MFIDSHCHLNMIDLSEYGQDLDSLLMQAQSDGVEHFLSVCVELADIPVLRQLAARYPNVSTSVGVHPNTEEPFEPDAAELVRLAKHPSCIAIGETGLDYYRVDTEAGRLSQQQRFREHIQAAISIQKPLIIHTRQAADDTIRIMQEEGADRIGGVMHCFAESLEVAEKAMALNFYISFSGIVTFKNALSLQEIAQKIPLNKMLIETDSPYLAPMPYRGKQNQPGLVKYVAEKIATLRGITVEEVALATRSNFNHCFRLTHSRAE